MSRYRDIADDHRLIQAMLEDIPSGSEEDTADDGNLVDVDWFTGQFN